MKAEGNRWGQHSSSKCVWHLLCAGRCPGTLSWDVGLGGRQDGPGGRPLRHRLLSVSCWKWGLGAQGRLHRCRQGRAQRSAPTDFSILFLIRFPVCSPRTCPPLGRWWVSVMHGSVPSKLGESLSLIFPGGGSSRSGLSICPSIHGQHPVDSRDFLSRGWRVSFFP